MRGIFHCLKTKHPHLKVAEADRARLTENLTGNKATKDGN